MSSTALGTGGMAPRAVTDPRWAYAGMGLCTLGIFVRLIGGGTEHVLLPDGGTVADAMRVLSPLVPWHSGVHMVYDGKVLEPQQGLGDVGITAGATPVPRTRCPPRPGAIL